MTENRLENLRKAYCKKDYETIDRYKNRNQVLYTLEMLKYDLENFDPKKDYSYFLETIPYLYKACTLEKQDQKQINKSLQEIRYRIKNLIIEKKSEKKSSEKILKKMIGKIEILSFEIRDGFDKNFEKYKFELLYYLIFSIKNTKVLQNILSQAPHQMNILDKKCLELIKELFQKYLDVLHLHVLDEKQDYLEELLYYNEALKILFEHNKEFINKETINMFNQMIIESSVKEFSSLALQERYWYFLGKWKNCFLEFLNTSVFNVPSITSLTELDYQYDIKREFSYGNLEMAKSVYFSTKFPLSTLNLPKVYTIDGKGACELDDGFSCERKENKVHLGIHLTNPLAYIEEENILFQEASKRVSSVYKGNKMIPMFPEILATDLFSLKEGNVRKCFSLYVDIDLKKDQILSFYPIEESVYVTKNDEYTSCNRTLRTETGDLEYLTTLKNVQKILPILKKYFKIEEMYKKIYRKKANISKTNIVGESRSERMIETMMVFANHMYAKYAIEHNIPCLFRNHQITPYYKEDLENYRKIIAREKDNKIYLNETKILESNYPKSFYGIENLGHFGLGVNAYTHFTSPDRRVADCFNMSMLKKSQRGMSEKEKAIEKEKLKAIANYINGRDNVISSYVSTSLIRKK